ncbi:uncharacterized protein LOC144155295 isoform X3 [Haemaphysalis longicornis]
MFAKKEAGAPNGVGAATVGTSSGSARDGSHCDLCGCTRPAVRCDKCNRQVFCLSCDDMYHRHPRRKSHLRRAVDSVAGGRPAVAKMPPVSQRVEGDPSHMPVPPPRKKKSLFSAFSRGPPSTNHQQSPEEHERHPALPKKEFSWTDKFGSIKRFMASRPLPPVPPEDEGMPPSPRYRRDHVPLNYAPNGVGAATVGTSSGSARDGSHCDLCGCTRPAVRCDKCNRQVFCLSCDDMYHRHPRRKSHLRRAVDSVAGGRPAVAKMPPVSQRVEGDPSHMPVPPPRKKKSLFSAFSRGPPSTNHQQSPEEHERHPALPKKEFSWTDKFGSIKRFMASRPLPPVPPEDEGMPPSPRYRRDHVPLNYVNVDPNPPAVPQRPPPRLGFPPPPQQHSRDRRDPAHVGAGGARNDRMMALDDWDDIGSASGSSHGSDESWEPTGSGPPGAEHRYGPPFRKMGPPVAHPSFGTQLRKHSSPHAFAGHKSGESSTLNRQSSSMTDLHGAPHLVPAATGLAQPLGPGYPAGAALRAPFGYPPMAYPLAPATPLGYYRAPFLGGSTGSWSNVNSAAEDGKETDDDKSQRHSTLDCRRIKRSQSCMHDPMMHPGPFYPFGYPAYPPMYPPPWMRPPSPSPSQHSLPAVDASGERIHRPHHRKHKKSLSKTASRRQSSQDLSSEEENDQDSPSLDEPSPRDPASHRHSHKTKNQGRTPSNREQDEALEKSKVVPYATRPEHSDAVRQQQARLLAAAAQAEPPQHAPAEQAPIGPQQEPAETHQLKWDPSKPWRCQHCTFINEAGSRICLICCKTTFREQSPAAKSDDEERQKKRAGFQDTLADKEIELSSIKNDADPPGKSEATPAAPDSESKPIPSADDDNQVNFTDDFIKEQQEVEKEIRRRLEIQMRIDEENRRIESAGVVQESQMVQHFQGDSAETESPSMAPQALGAAAAAGLAADKAPIVAQATPSYQSAVQQCHSSSQTMSADHELCPGTRESIPSDTTPAVTTQAVRPKVLYKASVATDTEDFTDPSTSSPALSDVNPERQERRRAFADAKAQSLDQPQPTFMQRKGEQPAPRGTRIGNLIRGIARHGSLADFDRPYAADSRREDDASSLVGATSSSYISEGRKQDYYLSLEELVQQRKQEQMRTQGLELVRLIREAEQRGFTADDLQVAMNHCGNDNPINWLRDNWQNMTETVVTLATNYGHDRRENTIGIVSVSEAQNALRRQKGNIWAAVTECVENRQRMFMELSSRGNFTRQEILAALTDNHGNMDMAYAQLTKATLKPFLMRIWGPGTGVDNDEGRRPSPLGDKREESVTDRVKDWLESLDAASQLPSSSASSQDERRAKRHSFHGSEQPFGGGHRDRSSSPASSFSSHRETSDVSSVSSATQGTSSRLEAILRRREVQKEFEKGRKSKKQVHADSGSKRRWTLASVFNAKKPNPVTKKDTFAATESVAQKSASQTTQDNAQLDSSSSGATVSTETLTSIEATGAKPKTFLGRFSSFKSEARKKDTNMAGVPCPRNGSLKSLSVEDMTSKGTHETALKKDIAADEPSIKIPKSSEVEGFRDEPPTSIELKKSESSVGGSPFSANRNAIENIKQCIHAAKISFMSSPPGPSAQQAAASSNEVSTKAQAATTDFGPAQMEAKASTSRMTENAIERDGRESTVDTEPRNEVKNDISKVSQSPPPAVKGSSHDSAQITAPCSSKADSSSIAKNVSPPSGTSDRSKIDSHVGTSSMASSSKGTAVLSDEAKAPSSSNLVPACAGLSQSAIKTTCVETAPKVVVETPGPENSNAAQHTDGRHQSLPLASSKEDETDSVTGDVKETEATSANIQQTNGNKSTRRTRPVRPEVDGATAEVVPSRKLGNRLVDASTQRRRERALPNGTVEAPDQDMLKPSAGAITKGGPSRRPSLRRTSREGADDCVVRDRDGNALIVKPQKPMERRGSVNARPGLQISKAVAANIAKLRSVPPPKKRKQVVQPRPSGKLPTEKQKQYKAKAEQLVLEGRCPSMVHAHLVAELIDMSFDEEDALMAAEQCDSIYQAVNFLQQECELCAANYPISQMVSLLNCVHRACNECLKAYFTIQIRDRNIMELLCPFCNEPDLNDEDVEHNYFNNIDILLKSLVDRDVYDLFQQKLRDRALMKDPNFRWCSQCSSGFITYPNQVRLVCPDCKAVTCATCRKPWQKQHEGITCEQYQEWQQANDPESQAEGITRYLAENGIDCPNCKFRYALARGGCMHFKCYQCGFDFCCGCNLPFKMGEKCGRSPNCVRLGLHAHHPRNCLFYLRDKNVEDLQRLLEESNVAFNSVPPAHWAKTSRCEVPEQKETGDGFKDDICGRPVEEGTAGLCRMHYVEYLGQLIFKHHIDPLPIFDCDELELVLKRANIRLPSRYKLSDGEYQDVLIKMINADVPLDKGDG